MNFLSRPSNALSHANSSTAEHPDEPVAAESRSTEPESPAAVADIALTTDPFNFVVDDDEIYGIGD